jgi:hypothetical protein
MVEFGNEHRLMLLGSLAIGDLGQRQYAADAIIELVMKRAGAKEEMPVAQQRRPNLRFRAEKHAPLAYEIEHAL